MCRMENFKYRQQVKLKKTQFPDTILHQNNDHVNCDICICQVPFPMDPSRFLFILLSLLRLIEFLNATRKIPKSKEYHRFLIECVHYTYYTHCNLFNLEHCCLSASQSFEELQLGFSPAFFGVGWRVDWIVVGHGWLFGWLIRLTGFHLLPKGINKEPTCKGDQQVEDNCNNIGNLDDVDVHPVNIEEEDDHDVHKVDGDVNRHPDKSWEDELVS